jgi:hypothetical protein
LSDFTVIRAVTRTLRDLLTNEITNSPDPQLSTVPIDLRSPRQMQDASALGISLYLYRMTRDPDLLNRPCVRVAGNKTLRQPIPVGLHYLATPIRNNSEDEHVLLGRVMQVFNDFSTLRAPDLKDVLQGTSEELRVTMETLTTEELTRIWTSLEVPYRLSVSYLVQVVTIDSDQDAAVTEPVLKRSGQMTQIVKEQ